MNEAAAEPSASGAPSLPVIKLKRHEDRRVAAGHLWVFSNEIDTAATRLADFAPGSLATVQSDRGKFPATPTSIRTR